MNTQTNSTNFFTSNADDTWYNNQWTRTAAVAATTGVVIAAGYYGYKAIKSSNVAVGSVGALSNAAGNAATAAVTTAAELSSAVASTL